MHLLLMELAFTILGKHKPKIPDISAKEKSDGRHLLAGNSAVDCKVWFTKQELSIEAMTHTAKQ